MTTIHHAGPVPHKAHPRDAAYDLAATHQTTVPARGRAAIPTGLSLQLPPQTVGMVCPRSGLALTHGLTVLNAPGIIDPDFTGEIQVILHNTTDHDYTVFVGDRVAQLLVVSICQVEWRYSPILDATERGAAGFGSTGR